VKMQPKGTQLKMFMSPREIEQTVSGYGDFGMKRGGPGAYDTPNDAMRSINADMMRQKEGRFYGTGELAQMHANIGTEGVKKPVELNHSRSGGAPFFENGHHRLISQTEHDPDRLMPVVHTGGAATDTSRLDTYRPDGRYEMDQQDGVVDPTGNLSGQLRYYNT